MTSGFSNWRPTLYAYCLWAICLCWGQVLMRGEHGKRTLFVLPAALFVDLADGLSAACSA